MIDDLILEDELDDAEPDPLAPFLAEGLVADVVGELKSGKEGTVYCCRTPDGGLVAAKVYRSREHRTFRNDAAYREGVVILNQHDARAMKKRTDWGRTVAHGQWIFHEWEILNALWEAGADVPRPIRLSGNAMLMDYIGDEFSAAPALHAVSLGADEVRPLFDRIIRNIELMLRCNCVHGDLSAYNILYHAGSITIIDFPQTVDPRSNPNAHDLLERDITNVCRYFGRFGVRNDPVRMTHFLWGRFLRAEL